MKRLLVPVFFTADENYEPYLSTALASLVDHVSKKNDYDVNVIYHNMKRSTMRKLEKIGKDVDNVNIILTEMQETLTGISDRKETRLKADCFTPTIYYRLFLPEMFPQYDKGIYLDSDIIVLGDVAELYKKELGENNILAACTDMSTQGNELFCKYFEDAVGVRHDKYFNSGVLLMDFKKFRDEEFCEHFFYMLNKYDFDTVAPDQDYLNALCKDRVMYLDYEWNTMPSGGFAHIEKPKIVHYNLFFKPWHYDGTEYEEYYWPYANKSAFIREIMREKKSFTRKSKKSDEERLRQMSERVEEILKGEVTFKKIFDDGKEKRG